MKFAAKSLLLLVWCASLALSQTIPVPQNENDLPSFSVVSDSDPVRIIKNGVSGKAAASDVRKITASKITDATVVGRNWIITASPSAVTFPMVNENNTITYLDATSFLAAISAGPASVSIRDIDGDPNMALSILEVTSGSLTDMGGGVARLTIGAGSGTGGAAWGSITGTLSSQTDLQAALDAKLSSSGSGAGLTGLVFSQLGGTATDAQIPNNITVDIAAVANAGDSATAFFITGQLERARGGTGADTSAFGNGLLGSDVSNATIDIDTVAEFSTALGLTGTASASTYLRGDGTWGTPAGGSGTPPGSDTQIIFNDGGAYGADSDLTWNKTTNTLTFPNLNTTNLNAAAFKVLDSVDQSHGYMFQIPTDIAADKSFLITGGFNFNMILTADSTPTFPSGTYTVASNVPAAQAATFTGGNLATTDDTLPEIAQKFNDFTTGPAGSDTQVIFNDGGVLAGDADLTWNKTTNVLTFPTMATTALTTQNFKVLDSVDQSHGLTWVVNGNWTANKTLSYTGEYNLAITLTGDTAITMPTSGTIVTDVNTLTLSNKTLTTPVMSGAVTFSNGFLYTDAAMGALVVDTAELNNTKSISADSTLTFSATPATGSIFGLQITNTDSAAHTITMPGSNSEALGGASRTTFVLWAGQKATLKWRYEGSSVYTVWGDPVRILDLTSASIATTDSIQFYDTTDGLSKRDTIANLSTLISSTFSRTGVRRTVYINAGAMIARITNGAATGTTELGTNDIMYDSFDFDSTTSEGVGFWWTPPTTYNGGTVTAKFNWTAASGSGTATWSLSARAFGDDDAMDQATGTAQAVTDTLITANDMHVTSTTSALTIAGTPAANKPTYWQITRDVADTLSADARLLGVTLEYTESSTEPSAQ